MEELRQVFRVEIVSVIRPGQPPLDEIDLERVIAGEIDLGDRIVSVSAERVHQARTGEVPPFTTPLPEAEVGPFP